MSRPSPFRKISLEGRSAVKLDNEGIPHFQNDVEPPLARSLSSSSHTVGPTTLSRRASTPLLDKATAEKMIRNAEEEQECVTLGLLQQLDQLEREKFVLAEDLEAQTDVVIDRLMKARRLSFTGPRTGGIGSECSASMPTPVSQSSVSQEIIPHSPIASAIAKRRQRSGSLLGSPSASPNRRGQPVSNIDTTASHMNLLLSQDTEETSYPSTGKPNLLVDYLTHSLEEAKALTERVQALEGWAEELYQVAEKFRVEVIEMRTKLDLASTDVSNLPERPQMLTLCSKRPKPMTFPSSKTPVARTSDLLTPTSSSINHDSISPLHCAAIINRRNSKGPLDAPLMNMQMSHLRSPLLGDLTQQEQRLGNSTS
ncbi:hypothetical protein CBS101457_000787 [Exobasidium rhododendri]|nr:hypothetical protein CBS101457_000787 [Exobasidium rhododendri]